MLNIGLDDQQRWQKRVREEVHGPAISLALKRAPLVAGERVGCPSPSHRLPEPRLCRAMEVAKRDGAVP